VTGVATLPEGTEIVMPGDNIKLSLTLITPIAMDEGCASRFARQPHQIGAVVTKILE
jgi:elongation factor Tu